MSETKTLTRSTDNRMIAGVAGGLGEYFDLDPTIFRLIFVLLVWGGGSGVLLYIILWVILPEEGKEYASSEETVKENTKEIKKKAEKVAKDVGSAANKRHTELWIGIGIVMLGFFFLAGTLGVPNVVNPFWYLNILVKYSWPLLLVALGLFLIVRNNGKK